MTDNTELQEYAAAFVDETQVMLTVLDAAKEACAAFKTDADRVTAIQAIEDLRTELVAGTPARILSAVMQPAAEDHEDETQEEDVGEATGTRTPRAGRTPQST